MTDLIKLFQDEFIGAWNAHDADRVLNAFAEDAVVTLDPPFPGAPGTFRGKGELVGFVQGFLSGIHVETRNIRASGNTVEWDATVSADAIRALGVELVEQSDVIVYRDGKVAEFTIHLWPDSHARLVEGAAKLAAQA